APPIGAPGTSPSESNSCPTGQVATYWTDGARCTHSASEPTHRHGASPIVPTGRIGASPGTSTSSPTAPDQRLPGSPSTDLAALIHSASPGTVLSQRVRTADGTSPDPFA